jgi:hypothetical protein
MKLYRWLLTFFAMAKIASSGISISYAQGIRQPLPALGGYTWEVRLGSMSDQIERAWKETLERISSGYSLRWQAYASAADRPDGEDGLEDPIVHSFLGIKDGARTLLVPEGMVLMGSRGAAAIRIREGDTLLRIPSSFLAEKGLRELPSEDKSRPISVRVQTLGIHSNHELHPSHAASVSRLVSFFPLPDEDWSEEERRASVAWMETLRKAPVDYALIERIDPAFGVCQMVVPVRASLISTRASSFLERHIDSFAAIPIRSSDRVTFLDTATLGTIWLPWETRMKAPSVSPGQTDPPRCILRR